MKRHEDTAMIVTAPSKEHPLGEIKIFPKKDLPKMVKKYFGRTKKKEKQKP